MSCLTNEKRNYALGISSAGTWTREVAR